MSVPDRPLRAGRHLGDPIVVGRDPEPSVDDPQPAGLDRRGRRHAQIRRGELGQRRRRREAWAEPEYLDELVAVAYDVERPAAQLEAVAVGHARTAGRDLRG